MKFAFSAVILVSPSLTAQPSEPGPLFSTLSYTSVNLGAHLKFPRRILGQKLRDSHTLLTRLRHDFRIIVPVEKRKAQSNGPIPAYTRFQSSTQRAGAERENRSGIPAIIRTGDHQVYGASILEEMAESDLSAAGWRAVDEDPGMFAIVG
ncbi:hypothetical protein AC578_8623 [Pseudocercospora eumusae]|uniref:Uncharacterized protein n=1 Tax=Pseudocercospora eumusae TaxID=321146 RepID=A0A139HPY1_9PEZI|nr:hypothetical protein AC578_8623 [Pseudocercospora eumusae]